MLWIVRVAAVHCQGNAGIVRVAPPFSKIGDWAAPKLVQRLNARSLTLFQDETPPCALFQDETPPFSRQAWRRRTTYLQIDAVAGRTERHVSRSHRPINLLNFGP
jgi:hypothetical protein